MSRLTCPQCGAVLLPADDRGFQGCWNCTWNSGDRPGSTERRAGPGQNGATAPPTRTVEAGAGLSGPYASATHSRADSPDAGRYDVFVSYAHCDNEGQYEGMVSALIAAIEEQHARFTPARLKVFFDRNAIRSMDDWEHRILQGLRESTMMLAVISPAYFGSEYCRREWEHYLAHEKARALPGEGVAPIYIISHPAFEGEAVAVGLAEWVANLKRRQYVDLRQWWHDGIRALEREDVKRRMAALEESISERLRQCSAREKSPSTVPPHNERFVGRVEELRTLRESLALGQIGRIVAIQGIAGIGKSALAFEYAHAYGDQYEGGRFLLPSAGIADLRESLLTLAPHLGIQFSESEQRNSRAAFERIRAKLAAPPRKLLVLDNVDDPTILAPNVIAQCFPQNDNLHVIATTQLDLGRVPTVVALPLDRLSDSDGRHLLECFRPGSDDDERAAALQIARDLGGHPLALELVAVYLWQNPEISFRGFLQGFAERGFAILGQESRIESLLTPVIKNLAADEMRLLEVSSLLPPDSIPLSWLKAIVGAEVPELVAEPPAGLPNPWMRALRRLEGLRLLVPTRDRRLARVHRLVQSIIGRSRDEVGNMRDRHELDRLMRQREKAVKDVWTYPERHWEVAPIGVYADSRLAQGDELGADLAIGAAGPLQLIGQLVLAKSLLERAIAVKEKLGKRDPNLCTAYADLGTVIRELGDNRQARVLHQKAMEMARRLFSAPNHDLAVVLSALAITELNLRNMQSARDLFRESLKVDTAAGTGDDPQLLIRYGNLATLEFHLGDYPEAQRLLHRAIEIGEKVYSNHPHLAILYSNLGSVETQSGNLSRARELFHRAIQIGSDVLGPDHPTMGAIYSGLSTVEQRSANLGEARRLLEQAIRIGEQNYGFDNPEVAVWYANMGIVEASAGDRKEAVRWLRRAYAVFLGRFGARDPRTVQVLETLRRVAPDFSG